MSENTVTIQLTYGAQQAGAKLPHLTMRRPKVKDQLLVQKLPVKTEAEREIRLFANLCEVPQDTIEDLDLTDYRKVQDAYTAFTKEGED